MTSKISFSKMVGEESRKLSWLTAVQLLVFGLLIPFRVLLVMASISSDQGGGMLYSQTEKIEILCRNIGYDQFENTFLIVAAGILCAYVAFQYLHSAVKLDFYHSLPVKRDTLFAVKYVSSILTFIIAYVASQFLAIVFALVFGCMNSAVFVEMLLTTVQGILFFLCSYSGAMLAIMLTGKMLTTVLATGVLGLYMPMLWLVAMMFVDVFFETSFTGTYFISERSNLRFTSPWALCLLYESGGTQGTTGVVLNWNYMLLIAAVTVVFMLVSLALYRIRKTEAAGKALAFGKIESIVKLLLTIPAALVAAMVAYELYASPVWELLFIVLFGALSCMIMEFIYRWDIRQVLMHKRHIPITVVVSAAVFFILRFDVTGYDTWLPEKSEIAAMAVKSGREGFTYEGAEGMEEGFSYYGASAEILDYLETEEFGPIYRLAQDGVQTVEDRNSDGDVITYIHLKYRLKNGKEVYRCYMVSEDLYYDVMNEMMKVEDFKERFYPILNWTEEYQKGITGYCYLSSAVFPELVEEYQDMSVSIPYNKVDELVAAYRKDLEELTFEEVWGADSEIEFYSDEDGYYYNPIRYPFGPEMEHTMEVIQELMK